MSAQEIIERLRQIANHDWRFSFLAHTSDTAKEAADIIEADRRVVEVARSLVALWESPTIRALSRAERNETIDDLRKTLIAAVKTKSA